MEPAWSYSALSAFEQCPLRYKLTRVSKVVTEPETEAIAWGKRVHTALEERIRDSKPLPKLLANYEGIAAKVAATPGEILVEQKVSITASYSPTGFYSKDVWCRGVFDVAVLGASKAVILDWKTGNRKDGLDQLKLFAGLTFATYPKINSVDTGFVWLKSNAIDRESFTREQQSDIWSSFLPRVHRLNLAFENDRWPAKPSGLCKKWCPVGANNCEFCGK